MEILLISAVLYENTDGDQIEKERFTFAKRLFN